MQPKLLVLIRHGESLGNIYDEKARSELEMGTADYPLTERGKEQVRITGAYLRQRFGRFDAAYTSHYRRARETLVGLDLGVPTVIEPLLAESNRGIWHNLSEEKIEASFPYELRRKKLDGLYHYRAVGGESNMDVEGRIALFMHRLANEHANEKVLAVVHGTWNLLLERRLMNHDPERFIERYRAKDIVSNASVIVYEARRPYLIGQRRRLVRTDYVVPWEGKLAVSEKQELA